MLRVIFCMSCCNAPKKSRESRGKDNLVNINKETDVGGELDFRDSKAKLIKQQEEKDQLLSNQIQVHNENYETFKKSLNETNARASTINNDKSLKQSASLNALTKSALIEELMQDEGKSITASTSALLEKSRLRSIEEDYTKYTELNFDDKSRSPPSSIDIGYFKGSPGSDQDQVEDEEDENESEVVLQGSSSSAAARQYIDEQDKLAGERATDSANSKLATSVTKIGDYARLEYSPIEDLDSITTKSHSRIGSIATAASIEPAAFGEDDDYELGNDDDDDDDDDEFQRRPAKSNATTANTSRRSSRGFESTSISIASQLSNEQFQQNLTNMIESANSPTAMFGTIGLPLGPPLDLDHMDGSDPATRKTSPETIGAALTSASQDSLSGADSRPNSTMNNDDDNADAAAALNGPNARPENSRSPGAALVGGEPESYTLDSMEDSTDVAPLADIDETNLLQERQSSQQEQQPRNESALSMTTTTSGQLTSPTPTPSELSSGTVGEVKKKSKLRPKNLLKRFKGGSKKNKSEKNEGSK